ncbi:MAG TPA: hypothetical protein VM075_01050 [Anaerolineae bacterium]|nr:hypothetical protein [Anaerolineae bacterium]
MRGGPFVRLWVVSLGLLIAGMSSGCGEAPPVDISLLTGEPCAPPCWQELAPGESTEDEVAGFIRTSRYVDPRTVYRGDMSRGGKVVGVGIQWRSTAADSRGVDSNIFDIEGGLLQSITIYPDCDVSLQDLLQKYGGPDKFTAHVEGVEHPYVAVTLYYPTHGFTADLQLPPDDTSLRPDSKVVRVWYFRAAPIRRFIQLGCDLGYWSSTPEEWLQFARDWQGYATIHP